MAPGVDGQAGVIAAAQSMAGVSARSISYIEAHGTATPLGDPIEITALTKAFRLSTDDSGFCAIGTAKANVGHLDAAAGVAGVIKTAISLSKATLPPLAQFNAPNPNINFADSPFYVNRKACPWRSDGPRRAGVSAFGVGGVNAHIVMEEGPCAAGRLLLFVRRNYCVSRPAPKPRYVRRLKTSLDSCNRILKFHLRTLLLPWLSEERCLIGVLLSSARVPRTPLPNCYQLVR